ncbi:MAG: universal stress protein, partial [Methylibium sp.]|nr:universal stress protein [Methylibium sp.]
MNYRSLLVLLDGKPRCDARVDLAACFAVAHGSHLIGVAPTGVIG